MKFKVKVQCVYQKFTSLKEIMAGQSQIVVCGGAENMTQYPFVVRNVRFGTVLGSSQEFEDSLWLGLIDSYCSLPMALTAEKLAKEYKIGRDETDDFALRSQELWKKGKFINRKCNLLLHIVFKKT